LGGAPCGPANDSSRENPFAKKRDRDVGDCVANCRTREAHTIFGRWPSFHDAEIHDLQLQRGYINPEDQVYEFPFLTIRLHLWPMTNDISQKGLYVSSKHTLTTMKFYDVDNFRMEGFNHQNAIFALGIEQKTRAEGPTPYFAVDFEPSFGIDLKFACLPIEIVDALSCDADF
jgi:Immunity protein 50